MIKNELIKQSPLRILDDSTHGGVGKGNLGVLAARHGVGKTGCLVHLATDRLLQNKPVIHVTFASSTHHVIDYYEEIFGEIAKIKHLDQAMQVHEEVIRNRMIMNFHQRQVSTAHVIESLKRRIQEGQLPADTVIIDEFDFAHATKDDLAQYKAFAAEAGLAIWFALSLDNEGSAGTDDVPPVLEKHLEHLSVLMNLRHHSDDDKVHLELVRDHGNKPRAMPLVLDSRTLLIAKG